MGGGGGRRGKEGSDLLLIILSCVLVFILCFVFLGKETDSLFSGFIIKAKGILLSFIIFYFYFLFFFCI